PLLEDGRSRDARDARRDDSQGLARRMGIDGRVGPRELHALVLLPGTVTNLAPGARQSAGARVKDLHIACNIMTTMRRESVGPLDPATIDRNRADEPAVARPVFERPGTVAEDVYEYLRAELLAGRLMAGTWLREQEVAKALRVSRTPVREAVRRLAQDG